MTKDEIIAMAREAGFSEWALQTPKDIERFAALVAAAEREACADVCEGHYDTRKAADAIRARGKE